MEKHHFVDFRPEDLATLRERLRVGDNELAGTYSLLLQQADLVLSKRISSVLDKTSVPPSGDKQDFFAIGHYSWPNPDTADGIPYIRRDGMSNPEAYASEKYDKGPFQSMVTDVNVLALAYYYSGDEHYAEKAAAFLRSWFINPTTRMNAHLRHAAAQPGVHDGLNSGIIEGVILIEMLDYVALLNGAAAWSDDDILALKRWFLQFSDWVVNSSFGVREFLTTNNHGSYYLAQVMSFAGYGGNHQRAESAIRFVKKQMDQQFASDGSMPRETKRSNAFFYSVYGLRAFVVLARIAERYGVDLWNYRIKNQEHPAIAKSFYFLSPYLTGQEEWSGARLDSGFTPYAIQICRMAGAAYQAPLFDQMVKFLVAQPNATSPYDSLVGFPYITINPKANVHSMNNATGRIKPTTESKFVSLKKKIAKQMIISGVWPQGRLH
jgi:hypothetical protein